MKKPAVHGVADKQAKPNIFVLLKPYKGMIAFLILFALLSNGANLVIPKIIAHGIDAYSKGHFIMKTIIIEFSAATLFIFIFTCLQSIIQTYASERVARDIRKQLSAKISRQSYAYIQKTNPSRLLTNLTSDIDSIKLFVSQAVVSITSSLFIIIGSCVFLLMINWKLALPVIAIIPIIGGTFFIVLSKSEGFI
jgi:ATP-binding cassette, subfamily B, bacterial